MSNKSGFFKRLKALSFSQKQLFATALCQRMLPNYQLFSEVCEYGNPQVLQTAMELLWQSQYDNKLKFNTDVHLQRIEEITPEPAEFEAYGAYPAMDAAVAVSTLLNAIQGKAEDDITNISKLSSSTVAHYIEALSDESLTDEALDEYVFAHPFMEQEKEMQNILLDAIESEKNVSKALVQGLRKEIIESGVSNIGISLD
ncbi:YjaG family protein [Shewanella maritima]|uniref:YjaG family protein n=1 Tax=Shewanella maritima TaxID=2520507 RepID=UPI003735582B